LHYISYFYSAKYDQWLQFNDESIKQVGSFEDVRKRCLAGRQRPTTLFYERSDVIMNVLAIGAGGRLDNKQIYFLEDSMRGNNFWTSNNSGGSHGGVCSMF
jgi:hypothetical protein